MFARGVQENPCEVRQIGDFVKIRAIIPTRTKIFTHSTEFSTRVGAENGAFPRDFQLFQQGFPQCRGRNFIRKVFHPRAKRRFLSGKGARRLFLQSGQKRFVYFRGVLPARAKMLFQNGKAARQVFHTAFWHAPARWKKCPFHRFDTLRQLTRPRRCPAPRLRR